MPTVDARRADNVVGALLRDDKRIRGHLRCLIRVVSALSVTKNNRIQTICLHDTSHINAILSLNEREFGVRSMVISQPSPAVPEFCYAYIFHRICYNHSCGIDYSANALRAECFTEPHSYFCFSCSRLAGNKMTADLNQKISHAPRLRKVTNCYEKFFRGP